MDHNLYLGVDIGGTKIEVALEQLSEQGRRCLESKRIPTLRDQGYDDVIKRLSELICSVLNENKIRLGEQVKAIGLAMPGSVDPTSNIMSQGNSQIFVDRPIAKDLATSLGTTIPVAVENDANCFALAESTLGAGAKNELVVGIILGTGAGSAIVNQGQIFRGRRGGAGEYGHLPLLGNEALDCYCGQVNCAELFVSGTALNLKAQQHNFCDSYELFNKAQERDEKALSVVKAYQQKLAQFLANITNSIDPCVFVLGGGLSNQDMIYDGIIQAMEPHLFIKSDPPKVLKNSLGDSSGSLGAAILAKQVYWLSRR
jgi:fructokinase